MNPPDDDFPRQLLQSLRTPPEDEEVRALALQKALHALQPPARLSTPLRRTAPWLAVAGALGALVLAASWWPRHASTHTPRDSSLALMTEMEKLFPEQLDAVVGDGPEVDVDVATDAAPAAEDQRIRLTVEHGPHHLQVLTYSGRRVCLDLGGQHVCLTPLLQGDGGIFVLTDQQVLRDGASLRTTGDHIHMRRLESEGGPT